MDFKWKKTISILFLYLQHTQNPKVFLETLLFKNSSIYLCLLFIVRELELESNHEICQHLNRYPASYEVRREPDAPLCGECVLGADHAGDTDASDTMCTGSPHHWGPFSLINVQLVNECVAFDSPNFKNDEHTGMEDDFIYFPIINHYDF